MDASRIIPLVFVCLSYILLSNVVVPDASSFICPKMMISKQYSNGTTININTTSIACQNGRNMSGCCIERRFCDYNTSNIDLSMYGPRGFIMSCGPDLSCCPEKYILHIPTSSNNTEDKNSDSSDSDDNSGDAANNNQVDSDSASDEADENNDKIPSFRRK